MDCDHLTSIICLCCTGVGRTGWHIDGSFMAKPFAYSTYHIVSCPTQAGTSLAFYCFSPTAYHTVPTSCTSCCLYTTQLLMLVLNATCQRTATVPGLGSYLSKCQLSQPICVFVTTWHVEHMIKSNLLCFQCLAKVTPAWQLLALQM